MKIEPDDAEWVVKQGEREIARFATNAEAWRFVDRRGGETISPSEERSDFGFRCSASGGR